MTDTPTPDYASTLYARSKREAHLSRVNRQRATYPWLVEGLTDDDTEPALLDYDASTSDWVAGPQRYATEAEALDRLADEVAHPGSDWRWLQVRDETTGRVSVRVCPPVVADATAALTGQRDPLAGLPADGFDLSGRRQPVADIDHRPAWEPR
jgi:hypothetical protein